MSPSTTTDVSAPTTVISFGTYFTARTLAVYASRSRSPVYFLTIAQDSLPAWRSPSSPVGFSPRVAYRSFWLLPPSSSARLVLAHCGSNTVTAPWPQHADPQAEYRIRGAETGLRQAGRRMAPRRRNAWPHRCWRAGEGTVRTTVRARIAAGAQATEVLAPKRWLSCGSVIPSALRRALVACDNAAVSER
jgi:hypothetical protein